MGSSDLGAAVKLIQLPCWFWRSCHDLGDHFLIISLGYHISGVRFP